jgi:hypothetical protein
MPTQQPVVKNGAGGTTFYVSLLSQANLAQFQSNPSLSAGDVKISIDGGAFANLNTLPTVTPAAGAAVKVVLSQAEANGDNLAIIFHRVADTQWCDLFVNIQTNARTFDDLAFPAASGQAINFTGSGGAALVNSNVNSLAAGAISAATFAAGALDSVWSTATRLLTAGTNIVLAKGTGVTGFNDLDSPGVRAAVGLASANLDAQLAPLASMGGSAPTAIEIADTLLDRDMAAGGDTGSPSKRTVRQALRFLRNKWSSTGENLLVMKEDDATISWISQLTTTPGAPPVTGSDPTSP